MAGCGQCPDTCTCNIVDGAGAPYDGSGSAVDPIVIPRAANTAWAGTSADGSVVITPGDAVPASGDNHAPDLSVNWCAGIDSETEREFGDILVFNEDEEDCKPEVLRDPLVTEFLGLDPGSGKAGWVQGAVIADAAVPYGVPLPFFGDEASVPTGYQLVYGQLVNIADQPNTFAVIGHNGNAGVDPGGAQFRLPPLNDRTLVGKGNAGGVDAGLIANVATLTLGGTAGVDQVTLALADIPAHAHGVTDPGHAHTINADGTHDHGTNTASRLFVEVEAATAQQVRINEDGGGNIDIVVDANDPSPGVDFGQKSDATTSSNGSHAHGGAVVGAATGVSIQNAGGGGAHNNLQPFITCNWIMRQG